ncbi:MAG TPA: hypothetical protein VGF27_05520 [Pseudoduganella sp.]
MPQRKFHPTWTLGTLSALTLLALWPALQGNRQLHDAHAAWRTMTEESARRQAAIMRASNVLGDADLVLLAPHASPATGSAALDRVSRALDGVQRAYLAGGGLTLRDERLLADLGDAGAAYRAAMLRLQRLPAVHDDSTLSAILVHGAAGASAPVSMALTALTQATVASQRQADGALADGSRAARRMVTGALASAMVTMLLACAFTWHTVLRRASHG